METSTLISVSLIVVACAASFVTASLGAGGGVMLLAVMAQVLPPQIIVPAHGIVQLGSNFGRAVMSRRHIDWSIIAAFVPAGTVLGNRYGFATSCTSISASPDSRCCSAGDRGCRTLRSDAPARRRQASSRLS